MTQEYDTTTERKLWFSGAWGRSLPTSFLQFGPDCIACHYYLEFVKTTIKACIHEDYLLEDCKIVLCMCCSYAILRLLRSSQLMLLCLDVEVTI